MFQLFCLKDWNLNFTAVLIHNKLGLNENEQVKTGHLMMKVNVSKVIGAQDNPGHFYSENNEDEAFTPLSNFENLWPLLNPVNGGGCV